MPLGNAYLGMFYSPSDLSENTLLIIIGIKPRPWRVEKHRVFLCSPRRTVAQSLYSPTPASPDAFIQENIAEKPGMSLLFS